MDVPPHLNASSHPGSVSGPLTVGHLARICWRRKWSALLMAILVGYGTYYASSLIVPLYQALATLRLDTGGRGAAAVSVSGMAEQTLLNTQRDLLLSSNVLRRAYESGPLSENPTYRAGLNPVELFANRLAVEVSRDSYRITVSLRDEEGKRAEKALDCLVAAFLHEQAAQQAERTANDLAFHAEQVGLARAKFNQARIRERELREKNALISANPEDNYSAVRLSTLNSQRTLLDQRLATSNAVLTQLAAVDQGHPAPVTGGFSPERIAAMLTIPEITKDPLVVDLQKAVADLRSDEARLTPIYLPKHPKMKEVLDALAFKQGELDKAVDAARTRFMGECDVLGRESTGLDAQLAAAKAALISYRNAQLEVQAQAEETRAQEVLFQQALARLSEKDLASRGEGAKMTPMDSALALPFPINIRPRTFLVVSVVFGLLAGLGMALVADTIDQRVRSHGSAEDLTRLPIIGRVPFMRHVPAVRQRGDSPEFRQFHEAFSDLRTALRLYRKGDGCQVLGVLSCSPGEGKTTVAAFLATSMAEANIRVLLIDGDLRQPSLHTVMEVKCARGLGTLLSGNVSDCLPSATTRRTLDFIGSGGGIANPAELLHSRHLPELLAYWRSFYDYIIIDTSPLGLVSDALLFGELADSLLWVVRDHVSRKDVIRQVREALAPLAPRLVGCIYNGDASFSSRKRNGYMTYCKPTAWPATEVAVRA